MSSNLQNYLITLIAQQNINFKANAFIEKAKFYLGVIQPDLTEINNIILSQKLLTFNQFYLYIYLPDILIYFGILVLIIQIGLYKNQLNAIDLFSLILKSSEKFVSMTFLILIFMWVPSIFKFNISMRSLKLYFFNSVDWISGVYIFNDSIKIDIYTQTLKIIICVIILFIYKFAIPSWRSKNLNHPGELILLFHICLALGFTIISTTHFGILLLSLEGFSLSLYILAILNKNYGGITAAVKYFVFGTLGSIFLFWGVVHIYAIIPSLSYKIIFYLLDQIALNNESFSTNPISFSFFIIVFGLFIKLGAAPLHGWVPDVYTGSHTLITVFFATVVKLILFMLFCSISYFFVHGALINFIAFLSLIIGTFLTLRQLEIKRFLAYSSITHVGFLLMGDFTASFTYILTYIIASCLFFSILLSLETQEHELIYLNDLRGLNKGENQWNAFLLVISLCSMAGLPPFAGFYGKFLIWVNLIEDIYLFNSYFSYFLLIFSISISLILIFYYSRVIIYLYIDADSLLIISESEKYLWNFNKLYFKQNLFNILQIQIFLSFLVLGWTFIQPFIIGISIETALCFLKIY